MKVHFHMCSSDKSRSSRTLSNVKLTFVETTDKRWRRLHDAGCLLLGGCINFGGLCTHLFYALPLDINLGLDYSPVNFFFFK